MKKIILTLFCLPTLTSANIKNVFEDNNLQYVTSTSPSLIQNYATGVAALSDKESLSAGCTTFRVSSNKMMTNFHCLPLVHKHFQVAANNGVFLGSISNYLFNFLAYHFKKEPVKTEIIEKLGFLPPWLPKNNKEMPIYMNQYPKDMGYISFQKTIDNTDDLKKSAIKITSVDATNEDLDYAVFTVENLPNNYKILKLSDKDVKTGTKLAIIGHPASRGMDGMKVYEASKNCEIVDANLGQIFNRTNNFGHHCDTERGSSGSPVFDKTTGEVIGLHWAGLGKENMNKAIKVKYILEDIKKKNLKLYKLIK